MKKIVYVFCLCVLAGVILSGCEKGNTLVTASFSNITMAGSENNTVKIVFSQDDRVDNRYYDVQIKANKNGKIEACKEFNAKKEVSLTTDWQSMTTLLLDEINTEEFVKGSEAVPIVFIFTTTEPIVITLRVVTGGVEDNASGRGQIITSTEICSKEFSLDLKTKEKSL